MPVTDLVKWWEKRRWIYNLVLLGSLSLLISYHIPFRVYVFYFVLANVLYTGGWAIEVLLLTFFRNYRNFFGRFRPWLFIFGCVLTLLFFIYAAWVSYRWQMENF